MAFYKHIELLTLESGQAFDELHDPGDIVPLSGVYACPVCRRSIVARRAELFPVGEMHTHEDGRPVLWRLVVRSHWA